VLRSQDRSFDFYWQLAEEVFTDVRDEDVVVQFQVSTISEWQQAVATARGGRPEGSGIMLLGRA
jgi:predicted HNH restriction endonuclease